MEIEPNIQHGPAIGLIPCQKIDTDLVLAAQKDVQNKTDLTLNSKAENEHLIKRADNLEVIMEAQYGFLRRDHRVVKYLQDRADALFPDLKTKICVIDSETDANAFSLPNGTVMITRGLFDLIEYEEEIDVILCHEITHYIDRHQQRYLDLIEEQLKNNPESTDSFNKRLNRIGIQRLAEYEADLKPFFREAGEKIHPGAARMLFTKIYQKETGKGDDVHGSALDRSLNVGLMTKIIDFSNSKKPLTKRPELMEDYAATKPGLILINEIRKTNNAESIVETLRKMTLPQQLSAALRLEEMESDEQGEYDIFSRNHYEKKKDYYDPIWKELIPPLQQSLRECLRKNKIKAYYPMLENLIFSTYLPGHKPDKDFLDDYEDAEEMMEDFETITSGIFEKLGIRLCNNHGIDELSKEIVLHGVENDFFNENGNFCNDSFALFMKRVIKKGNSLQDASISKIEMPETGNIFLQEALLQIDARDPSSKMKNIFKIIETFFESGFKKFSFDLLGTILEAKHLKISDSEKILIRAEIMRSSKTAPLVQEVETLAANATNSSGNETYEKISLLLKTAQDVKSLEEWIQSSFRQEALKRQKKIYDVRAMKQDGGDNPIEHHLKITFIINEIRDEPFDFWKNLASICLSLLEQKKKEPLEAMLCLIQTNNGDNWQQSGIESISRDFLDGCFESDNIETLERVLGEFEFLKICAGTSCNFEKLDLNGIIFQVSNSESSDSEAMFRIISGYYIMFEDLANKLSKREFFAKFSRFLSVISEFTGAVPTGADVDNFDLLSAILERFEFDLNDEEDLERLVTVVSLEPDAGMRARLQRKLMDKLSNSMQTPKNKIMDMMFRDIRMRAWITRHDKEKFIDRDLESHEEIGRVKSLIEDHFHAAADQANLGKITQFEDLENMIHGKRTIFESLFTEETDLDLCTIIYEFNYNKQDLFYSQDLPITVYDSELSIENIYKSDESAKYFILKSVLLGKNGLLKTNSDRKWLLDVLCKRKIENPDASNSVVYEETMKVLATTMRTSSEEHLFYILAPLLIDHILVYPKRHATPAEALKAAGVQLSEKELEELKKFHTFRNNIFPSDEYLDDSVYCEKIRQLECRRKLIGLLGEDKKAPTDASKWSIAEFVLKMAENMGAPGVRFLQILGQFTELPPELEKQFQDVYDNIHGQGKLTAYMTCEREWPEFKTEIHKFKQRIGGGSLLTAYLAENYRGEKEVIKVANPNTRYHTREIISMMKAAAEKLAKEEPEKYSQMITVIDEIESWIEQDLDYDKFLERDKFFRDQNDGFSVEPGGYSIYIPRSIPVNADATDNYYIKREEYIDGRTLHRLEEEDRKNLKSIVKLIAYDTLQQINSGLMHSDIHIGNYMVFTDKNGDKKVAIIDRNNYMEIDDDDRELLVNILLSPDNMTAVLLAYLRKSDLTIPAETDEELKNYFDLNKTAGDPSANLFSVIKVLREKKVNIPLKLTLLLKNLNGLRSMAKTAGYGSLSEIVCDLQ